MARSRTDVAEVDVDETVAVDETDEVDVVVDPDGKPVKEKAAKKAKEPTRGDLPEGYVTPSGLAKILTDRGLHTNRAGEVTKVLPQMVYSYIKNAPKTDPFPLEEVTDSIGKTRQALTIEAGLAWWTAKNERVSARRVNAAEKEAKKAKNAAAKAEGVVEVEGEAPNQGEVTEAE